MGSQKCIQFFFFKQYQLISNIYTFKESKAYKRENNTTVLSGIF